MKIALAVDMWKDHQMKPFGAIKVFYVDKEWKIQQKLLDFQFFSYEHTRQNIFSWISRCLSNHKLTFDQIISMTTDNAINMT